MDVPKTFLENVHRDLAHNDNMMAIVSVTQSLGYREGAFRGVYPKVSMYLLFVNTCVFLIGE